MAFRLILVVPHMFLLFFLGIAALVVAFLGWWGALFTGRLPEFAVNYLSGFMRWVLRYQAYLYLLTDVYPPFTLDDVPEYPVRLAIPERQRLNRAAVFFRFILAIPGMIVSAVATEGASSLVLFVAWLIALVNGHLPRPLHQALTALLRYQIRFYCYYWMLTPAYPWGLFGDAPGMPPAAAGYAPQDGGYGYGNPGYTPGYGTPASVYGRLAAILAAMAMAAPAVTALPAATARGRRYSSQRAGSWSSARAHGSWWCCSSCSACSWASSTAPATPSRCRAPCSEPRTPARRITRSAQ